MHGTESGASEDEEPVELEVLQTDLSNDEGAIEVVMPAEIGEVGAGGDEGVEGGLEEPVATAENALEINIVGGEGDERVQRGLEEPVATADNSLEISAAGGGGDEEVEGGVEKRVATGATGASTLETSRQQGAIIITAEEQQAIVATLQRPISESGYGHSSVK